MIGDLFRINGAGTVEITASQEGNASASAAVPVTRTVKINKGTVTLSLSNLNQVFTGKNTVTATTSRGNMSGISVTYNGSTALPASAGTYTVEASLNNVDFAAANVQEILTLTSTTQTITFDPIPDKTYGVDAPFGLKATGGPSGNPIVYTSSNPAIVQMIGNLLRINGAGTVEITASQEGNASASAAAPVTRTVKINKGTVTLSLSNLNQVFTGKNTVTATTSRGNMSGISVTYNGSAALPASAGTYAVEASLNNKDFVAENVRGTLVLPQGTQVITFDPIPDKTYGVDAPFSLKATGGPSGNPIVYTSSNPAIVQMIGNLFRINGAGTVEITASQEGNASASAAAPVTRTLTINKGTVTLSVDNVTRNYDGKAIPVTVTTSRGNMSGISVTYNGSAAVPSAAGTYTVEASLNNKDFVAEKVQGTLTIRAAEMPVYTNFSIAGPAATGKAEQGILAPQIERLVPGADYDLSQITASSGLPLTFTSSNSVVASVNGHKLHANQAGEVTLTITQAGDQQYKEAAVARIVTVEEAPKDNDIQLHQAVSPNGDGINDVLHIEGIEQYPDNKVMVMDRNGVKVFELKGYDNSSKVFDGHSTITRQMQLPGTYFYVAEYNGKRITGWFVLKY
jgi:gliding motility-associated-like protein